jgi:hypothetical protein
MSSEKLKLVTLCAYLTETSQTWRQDDWDASKMVKALKGDPINRYFSAKIGGQVRQFTQANAGEFVERIPRALAKVIARHVDGKATIVPIPNSHVVDPTTPNFKTLELAEAVAKCADGQFDVIPALVFSKPQPKSRQGGSRSALHFQSVYRVTAEVTGPIVLLDDVCTSGAHIIGAHWKLDEPSRRPVVLASAFGRSTKQQVPNPIGLSVEMLDVGGPFSEFDD